MKISRTLTVSALAVAMLCSYAPAASAVAPAAPAKISEALYDSKESDNFLYDEMEKSYLSSLEVFFGKVKGQWVKLTGVGYGESGDRVVESILGYSAPDTGFQGTSVSGGLNSTATICLPLENGFQDCVYGTVDEPIIVDGPPWLLNDPWEGGLAYSLMASLMSDVRDDSANYEIVETDSSVIYRISVVDTKEELEFVNEYTFASDSLVFASTFNGNVITRVAYEVVPAAAVPPQTAFPSANEIAPALTVIKDVQLISSALEEEYTTKGRYPLSVVVNNTSEREAKNPAVGSTYQVCYNSGAKKINYVIMGGQAGSGWYWEQKSDLTDVSIKPLNNGSLPSCASTRIPNAKGVNVPGIGGVNVGWTR